MSPSKIPSHNQASSISLAWAKSLAYLGAMPLRCQPLFLLIGFNTGDKYNTTSFFFFFFNSLLAYRINLWRGIPFNYSTENWGAAIFAPIATGSNNFRNPLTDFSSWLSASVGTQPSAAFPLWDSETFSVTRFPNHDEKSGHEIIWVLLFSAHT